MHVKALIEFLTGLEQNNNRPWFAWNKPAYDVLRDEFEALVGDISARLSKFDRALGTVDPKKAMFRIYRDTRFSKDRTPYKTHFSAAIRDRAKRGLEPGYYFHIDHRGTLLVGGGIYRPQPEILARIRRHIAEKPQTLTRLLRNRRFRKTYDGLSQEDALVRPPKGFFGMVEINLKRHPPKNLAADIAAHFRDLLPLMEWLREAAADPGRKND